MIQAHSADDAVQILKESDCAVEVVFSDVEMPGKLNGIGLANWVRRERSGVVTILTSGQATMPKDVRTHGPLMHKPYHVPDVEKLIRKMAAQECSSR